MDVGQLTTAARLKALPCLMDICGVMLQQRTQQEFNSQGYLYAMHAQC